MVRACVRAGGIAALIIVSASVGLGPAAADPIEVLLTYHFRSGVSPNTLGVLPGDVLTIAVDVRPNLRTGDGATTVKACQPFYETASGPKCALGAVERSLPYLNSPAIPNQFGRSDPYDSTLTGQWLLIVENPNSSNSPVKVKTPSVGDAEIPAFIRGFSLAGAGATPTFDWQSSDPPIADQTLFISRRNPAPNGPAQIIHLANNARLGGATTYTVPNPLPEGGSLQSGERYWVNINLNKLRPAGDPVFSTLLSRSRSIFEFLVQTTAPANPIFLPYTDPDGTFRFDIAGVGPQVIFIDPPVATGYDYATGPGDPNFASVILPAVGDGVFRVHFRASGVPVEETVVASEQFFFPAGGVAAFGVRGIEATAGLNPEDATAFVTGLTFVADGAFTGTMTPVVLNVGEDPTCNGLAATIFVRDGRIVGGPDHGQPYRGVLTGTNGDDVIVGTDGPDRIKAFAGDDTICALGGADVIDGGDGNDWIEGGLGNDQIKGGRGDDTILAGDGHDIVEGGPGDDWIDGAGGNDRIKGQDGNDAIFGGEGDDIIDGGPGDDMIDGGPGKNSIKG